MKVDYELTGPSDAPVVVLSNSLGNDRTLWDAQVPALAEHFRVLRYDQRGHGATAPAPGPYDLADLGGDVLELLDDLGIASAHFAGVSLGGMTGMWLAENAPERIATLVPICTSANLDPRQAWLDRAAQVRANGTASMFEATLPRWFTPALSAEPQVRAKYRAMLTDTDDESYAACCEAIASMDILDALPSITAPTLVIAGAADSATPPAHGEQIADAVPGAKLEVLAEAAHLANAEQPEAVNELLVAHFSGGAR